MEVILRKNVENLGSIGDTANVKKGYARNYLIPRELAYLATDGARKRIELEKRQYVKQIAKEKEGAEKVAEKLAELQISIPMKVGEEGRLYGSVTPQMIAQELSLRGYDIDRHTIVIDDSIKSLKSSGKKILI